MNKGLKKTVSVLVPPEMHRRLTALAERSGRSLSSYVRQVLRAHLRDLEPFQGR